MILINLLVTVFLFCEVGNLYKLFKHMNEKSTKLTKTRKRNRNKEFIPMEILEWNRLQK